MFSIVPHIVLFFCVKVLSLDSVFLRIESKHEVTILGGLNEFIVKFFGPSGSKSEHIFMFCFRSKFVLFPTFAFQAFIICDALAAIAVQTRLK